MVIFFIIITNCLVQTIFDYKIKRFKVVISGLLKSEIYE